MTRELEISRDLHRYDILRVDYKILQEKFLNAQKYIDDLKKEKYELEIKEIKMLILYYKLEFLLDEKRNKIAENEKKLKLKRLLKKLYNILTKTERTRNE